MLVLLVLLVLSVAWFSVIDASKVTSEQLQLFAHYLEKIVYDYSAWYLIGFGLLYVVGIIFQLKRMYVLNQVVHFIFLFFPMLFIFNQMALIYRYSMFLPAYNIPYYILLAGLVWVVWQLSKFMSSSESTIAFKFR